MFIHPANLIKKGVLTNVDGVSIQPNAIDLRIKSIKKIDCDSDFILTENHKSHREVKEVYLELEYGSFWCLSEGQYQIETTSYVEIPEGMCGWVIPRSTLNRNGIFVISGLYDSGFNNFIGATMYITGKGKVKLEKNVRFGQFLLAKSESIGLYRGGYNATNS